MIGRGCENLWSDTTWESEMNNVIQQFFFFVKLDISESRPLRKECIMAK